MYVYELISEFGLLDGVATRGSKPLGLQPIAPKTESSAAPPFIMPYL